MQHANCRRGIARVATLTILAGMVGACADQTGTPAPVYMRGAQPAAAAMPVAPPMRHEARVTVRRGQTLTGIARDHHVRPAAIIAANRLQPPYELKAGAQLIVPQAGAPVAHVAAAPMALPAPVAPQPHPAPPPQPPAAQAMPEIVPLDGPPPKEAAPVAQSHPAPAPAAPVTAAANGGPPPVLAPRNPAAALPLPGEAPPAVAAERSAASGRFAWPVQGRILVGYGAASNGSRNDGINIAAPRGTPVHAIESGTVAYVGNEVKGYGNLVLVKHDNGWISAYAHLDAPAVKVGDKIAGGQVIARVGETGGVSQPQLHFELRRGRKPVDPREFLAPAPSAGGAIANPAG